MVYINKNHVLPRCKIFSSLVRSSSWKQPSDNILYMNFLKIWELLWKVSYKVVKFIEKYPWKSSFLSTLQACKLHPKWKMNFSAGIFKRFSYHIVHVLSGAPPSSCFWTQSHKRKKNIVHEINSPVHFLEKTIFISKLISFVVQKWTD